MYKRMQNTKRDHELNKVDAQIQKTVENKKI